MPSTRARPEGSNNAGSGDSDLPAPDSSYLSRLRRVPTRGTAHRKVQSILDAAEALITEVGYEAAVATPEPIIRRAQVSGGSFYTYFSGAEDVLQTLALRILDEFRQDAVSLTDEVWPTWLSAAEGFFDFVTAFYDRAIVRQLWVEGHLSRDAREADDDANAWTAERLANLLGRATQPVPALDPSCFRVAIEIMDYVTRLAYRVAPEDQSRVRGEARHAFLAYLTNSAERFT